ncbi:MAG: YeeE/YedE thiosulfate transporter family protein [Thermoleophilia bacterium]
MTAAALIIGQINDAAQTATEAAGTVGGTNTKALVAGLLTGIAFGALLQRAGASSFTMIVNMLRLKDLTIMKFLFVAIATGSVGIYIVDSLGGIGLEANIGIAPVYLLALTVGGLIFGVGWALAGYCPGTALVAMGQGKIDAFITVLGGLVGAFTLVLTWDYIQPTLEGNFNYGNKSLADVLGANPLLVALVMAAAIVALVLYLNRLDTRKKATGSPGTDKPGAVTSSH